MTSTVGISTTTAALGRALLDAAELEAGGRVLDVGCGIGDNARALSALGCRVAAISPDANHGRYVAADPRIEFVQTRFEDFTADRRFDLVLMSESQNYFDAGEGFRRARALLEPDGHLLVSGMFRRAGSTRFAQTRNDEREYLEVARREGFAVRARTDITAHVLPTLVLARAKYADHLKPAIDLAVHYVRGSRSWKVRLLRRLLARRIDELAAIRRYYEDFFDPALFQQHVVYATLLFSPDPAAGPRT